MLLTGDTIDGRQACDWGLVIEAVPEPELDAAAERLAARLTSAPFNQPVLQKLMVNQALDIMGLQTTQMVATLFDGITRHSPEGRWFVDFAQEHGFDAAVRWRDDGRFIPDRGGPTPTKEQREEPHRGS